MVLSLVSLAHRVQGAEALNPALQTRVPSAKQLCLTLQLGEPCTESLRSELQFKMAAAGRPCAETLQPSPIIWSLSSAAVPASRDSALPHRETPLSRIARLCSPASLPEIPIRQPRPWPVGDRVCSRAEAHTFPLDQRVKLECVCEKKKE